MKKDVVYIDNDDEIASITDKVQSSPEKIVALVLPKRCTVLQSSVNMKILNKAANDEGKKVVLITSEAGLLPLAGAAGLFVAKTLQTKPAVPAAPQIDDAIESVVEAEADAETEPQLDETKSIGELAGDTPEDDDAPIELGDDPEVEKETEKPKKEKKDKKLAVPNFDSFRVKLFAVIGGIILLIVLWFVLFNVLPKANVIVKIQYKSIPVTLSATGSTTATTTDTKAGTVPEQVKTLDKTETKKFSATGEKDNGTKATGKVSFSIPCSSVSGAPPTIPAGTGVSSGGLTFITQDSSSLTTPSFSGGCKFVGGDVSVIAQNAGDKYNVNSGRTFTVAGFASVTGTNSTGMGGGTSKIIKVVSASDCDNAKNELLNANTDANKAELESQLKAAGQTPLSDTFAKTSGTATCTPGVDQEATESTATAQLKFTMIGVSTEGLNQLIDAQIQSQLGPNEKIYDNGLSTGKITIKEKKPNGDVAFEFTGTAKVGVKQDSQVIAQTVAGKKYGDSVSAVKGLSGVSDVTITYSPFYVRSTPKDLKKITVTFESQNVSP
jgi:hypothetical protein